MSRSGENTSPHLMPDRPLHPAHLLRGLCLPLDARILPRQFPRMRRPRVRLRDGEALPFGEVAQGRDEEAAALLSEGAFQGWEIGVGRESRLRGGKVERHGKEKRHGRGTHLLLSEDPAAIKPPPTQFLHRDPSFPVSRQDTPLNGRRASPAREQRRMDVEGVEGLKVCGEERGRDQVAERGGEEQVLGRSFRAEEGIWWLWRDGARRHEEERQRGEFPKKRRESLSKSASAPAGFVSGRHKGATHLPAREERLFGQSHGLYAEFLCEQPQAGYPRERVSAGRASREVLADGDAGLCLCVRRADQEG